MQCFEGLLHKKKNLRDKVVLVTAGPTYEAIDPVRFIGNHSSGKMGFAIAESFAQHEAQVELVAGPVNLKIDHPRVKTTSVTTAEEMATACFSLATKADIIIMAAAVADFTPVAISDQKIKKHKTGFNIKLKPTIDILSELGEKKTKNQVLVGFALETDNELKNAMTKLKNKNLDMIVLNSLKDEGAGFGHQTNMVSFIDSAGNITRSGLKSKKEIADDLVKLAMSFLKSKKYQ